METTKNNPLKKQTPVLDKIRDEKLRETLILLKTSTNIKINYDTKLEDPQELEEYFKEELEGYLNEKYRDVHEKVSELREKGRDMVVWTFKLMQIPLKIKVFLSTGDKKDFNNVTGKMNEINNAASATLDKIKQREEIYRKRKLKERKIQEQKLLAQKKKVVQKKVTRKKTTNKK